MLDIFLFKQYPLWWIIIFSFHINPSGPVNSKYKPVIWLHFPWLYIYFWFEKYMGNITVWNIHRISSMQSYNSKWCFYVTFDTSLLKLSIIQYGEKRQDTSKYVNVWNIKANKNERSKANLICLPVNKST